MRRQRGWMFTCRNYAVKELPWCSKGGSLPSTGSDGTKKGSRTVDPYNSFQPIGQFGVVAAMSLNRIIGVNGSLPWEGLDQDRKIFTDLTMDKLLILGRETFQERPDLSHIRHASSCIVVSTTMNEEDLRQWEEVPPKLKIARSFPEALDVARRDCSDHSTDHVAKDEPILCWVVGGERLYNEAVMHSSLEAIHLSVVNKTIEEIPGNLIRRFPPKYRWDNKFRLVGTEQYDAFQYYKYVRNRGFF